jgi:hypothetical protein
MTSAISMRAYTGANAGTESAAQTSIDLCAADALSGGPVLPGTVSFERWLRLRVDSAPAIGVANFWLMNTGDLPDGVALKFGVTDTPATPVNTVSTVATKELTSGQKFVFDAATLADVGDHSRYIVIQEVVDADAASGAIPAQALVWGWLER